MVEIFIITCMIGATSIDACGESNITVKLGSEETLSKLCDDILSDSAQNVEKYKMFIKDFQCIKRGKHKE